MSKRKTSKKIYIGDVFAVPLDHLGHRYGYVRMYNDPDVAVLGVVSGRNLLNIEEVAKYQSVMDVFVLRTAIEKGLWPYIGNIPFDSESDAWPGPRKQVAKFRPDLRMVIYKGDVISADEFGEYDDLPEWRKFTDERLVKEILSHPDLFTQLT